MTRLDQYAVLSFDCYGTLIDWETGIMRGLDSLTRRLDTELSRQQVLSAFASNEAWQERETPGLHYAELLSRVYRRLAHQWRVSLAPGEAEGFGACVGDWQPFADTVDALAYLKQHYQLVILSNVDRRSFAASAARLGVAFDAVYTAEEIGSYKPSLDNFRYLLAHLKDDLERRPEQLLHVAQSLYHDHVPANQLGLASAWIDRQHHFAGSGATPPVEPAPHVDFRFETLAALVEAHKRL